MLDKNEQAEIMSHFTEKISQEIVDYATDVVLRDSRYIFVKRSGSGKQYGYCTHCKQTYPTKDYTHNSFVTCEKCDSKCMVKSSGRGRKYLLDTGYFVWYERSVKDKNTITARGIYVRRDYSGDYKKVETTFRVTAMYLFEQGKSTMIQNYYWNENSWELKKSIISESGTTMQNIRCFCSHDSIKNAVKGTLFQYSTWEKYLEGDMLKFFDLAAKYPCIEYLTKLGLSEVVRAKLYGFRTYGAINWRGKTIEKVLKLSKQEIKEIKDKDMSLSTLTLYFLQQSKKDGSKLSINESQELSRLIRNEEDVVKQINQYTSLRKIYQYIKKQFYRKNTNHYYAGYQVLTAWRDYLRDCQKLEMDTSEESILFPTYLYKAHQKTIEKVKYQEDQKLNTQLQKVLKKLRKYQFEYNGLLIRPVQSIKELNEEGNALKHCVGGYANSYVKGETSLFVIRKVSQPDMPFYTAEIKNNRITQAYGFRNCLPTKNVQLFLDTFTDEKLAKKKKERKVAV